MPFARPKHNPPKERPSSHARGYDARHRKWAKLVLSRDPICKGYPRGERCLKPSTQADHIVPIALGGEPLDLLNGQGLCRAHHLRKTMDESR